MSIVKAVEVHVDINVHYNYNTFNGIDFLNFGIFGQKYVLKSLEW